MRLPSAIAVASATEIALAGACLGLLSVAGRWNEWLDLFAQFAPFWLALSVIGAILAWLVVEPGLDRRVVMSIAAIGVLSNGALVVPEYARAVLSIHWGGRNVASLKVLTFNVWDENIDADATVAAILRTDADVVALQEVAGLGANQRAKLLTAYPFWIGCRPTPCDIALMSKRPWANNNSRIYPEAGGLAVVWGATAAADGQTVQLATTHYSWPLPFFHQAAQRAALARLVGGLDASNLILTVDSNLAPWSAALANQDHDLAPLVRRTRAVFTWPAVIAGSPAPFPLLPIDHIYAGHAWRTVAVTRLPRAGSDHYGVLATLARVGH
jgi:endonuclease/exonuclease/phosphatase (EEP) superfamily protein YafD